MTTSRGRSAAIIGSGQTGVTAALGLLDNGFDVTLYSDGVDGAASALRTITELHRDYIDWDLPEVAELAVIEDDPHSWLTGAVARWCAMGSATPPEVIRSPPSVIQQQRSTRSLGPAPGRTRAGRDTGPTRLPHMTAGSTPPG
jgi:hypothetical protein